MPNWCFQEFEVTGNADDLKTFVKATEIKNDEGHVRYGLNHLFPIPEELANTVSGWSSNEEEQAEREKQYAANTEKYGWKDWYDWAYANWSTKWGACEFDWNHFDAVAPIVYEDEQTIIVGYFESAWGPASGLIKKISGDYPNLIFSITFTEESNAFFGCEVFHQGEMVFDAGEDGDMPESVSKKWEAAHADENLWDEAYQAQNDWMDTVRGRYEFLAAEAVNRIKNSQTAAG